MYFVSRFATAWKTSWSTLCVVSPPLRFFSVIQEDSCVYRAWKFSWSFFSPSQVFMWWISWAICVRDFFSWKTWGKSPFAPSSRTPNSIYVSSATTATLIKILPSLGFVTIMYRYYLFIFMSLCFFSFCKIFKEEICSEIVSFIQAHEWIGHEASTTDYVWS